MRLSSDKINKAWTNEKGEESGKKEALNTTEHMTTTTTEWAKETHTDGMRVSVGMLWTEQRQKADKESFVWVFKS